jgi:hypothetical protein
MTRKSKKLPYPLYTKEEILNVIEIMLGKNLMLECRFEIKTMHGSSGLFESFTETKSIAFRSHRAGGAEQKFWITGKSEEKS